MRKSHSYMLTAVPASLVLLVTLLLVGSTLADYRSIDEHSAILEDSQVLVRYTHLLQSERLAASAALTLGVYEAPALRYALQQQETHTNAAAQVVINHETIGPSDNRLVRDRWRQLKHRAKGLAKLREGSIGRRNLPSFLTFASTTIDETLELMTVIGSQSQDAAITREFDLYNRALQLEEYVSKEASVLIRAQGMNSLNMEFIQQISDYAAGQERLIHRISQFEVPKSSPRLKKAIDELRGSSHLEDIASMRRVLLERIQEQRYLGELQALIGYGGLIHDFKNFVLRGDERYSQRFGFLAAKVDAVLSDYERLGSIGSHEKEGLISIRRTVASYSTAVRKVKQLRAKNKSTSSIDTSVAINDTPAFSALTALRNSTGSLPLGQWRRSSEKRVSNFVRLSSLLRDRLQLSAKYAKQQAMNRVVSFIALALFILTGSILLVRRQWRLENSLISEIAASKQVLEKRVVQRTAQLETLNQELRAADAELRQEQAKLIQAEKLTSIGVLAAGIAHEVNNPLAGIIAGLGALRSGSVPEERRDEYFETFLDGLERIKQIVRGLTDYARKSAMAKSPIKLHEVLDSCVALISPALQKKMLKIENRVPDNLVVFADRTQIMQALVNIILNAAHASPKDGLIEIYSSEKTGFSGILIQDQGDGIPEEIRDKVLDPFFTTKPDGEGTGLGLSVTAGLINANGGHLEFSGEPGEGATVAIWLPPS